MSSTHFDNDAISFAERALTLVDQGRFTATYKYAVLLGLMDLALELSSKSGRPPQTLTTKQLAEKIIEIYWPHTNPFMVTQKKSRVLLQNQGRDGSQAEIINLISQFRSNKTIGEWAPYFAAKFADAEGFKKLVNKVEWKLIEMPLPKLQRIGSHIRPFIYTINWDDDIAYKTVAAYQRGEESDFDNRIILRSHVGEYLVRLNSLLRPLIQREWSLKVAQLNKLEESKLQNFLFESARAGAAVMCGDLAELQEHRCFYCNEKLAKTQDAKPEVDHFIPWARYPNDNLANYVVAHSKCNRDKRDYLAGNQHIAHWVKRVEQPSTVTDLNTIAAKHKWLINEQAAQGVASAIYLHLQPEVELWKMGKEFEVANTKYIKELFS
jgi:5-methylcytosine-specific restriction endonuclease McrA